MTKHIVYITGVTGMGKTTLSKRFVNEVCPSAKLVSADKFYDWFAIIAGRRDYDNLVKRDEWKKYPEIGKYKKKWYSYYVSDIQEDTIIIEGATLRHEAERRVIESCVKNSQSIMLHLDFDYELWNKFTMEKYSNTKADKKLKSAFDEEIDRPKWYYKVKHPDGVTPKLVYQRDGFTDEKFKRLAITGLSGKSVLDIGCNAGWFGDYCKELGASSYLGIDNQWRETLESHKHWGDHRLYDMNRLDKNLGSFDVVLFTSTLHYADDRVDMLERVKNITLGYAVVEMPVSERDGMGEDMGANGTYSIPTKKQLESELSDKFKSVKFVGQSIPPDKSYRPIYKCYV